MKSEVDKRNLARAEEMLNDLMAVVDGKAIHAFIKQEDGGYIRNPEVPEKTNFAWKGDLEE